MKRIAGASALLLTLLITLTGCGSTATLDQQINNVSPSEAAGIIGTSSDDLVKDSINIDFYAADFREQLDGLDKDTHYLVYCNSGNRSGQALPIFEDLGFAEVDNLSTGIAGWYNEGYEVVP